MIKTLFPPHIKIKNPLYHLRGFANWFGEILRSRSHYVARLEAFRAFEQIELDSLAFIQRAVAVLLDGREMHEDILAGGALDESVSLRPVEPLHSTLLSHKETPFASAKNYSFAACLFAQLAGIPSNGLKNFFIGVAAGRRKHTKRKRLPGISPDGCPRRNTVEPRRRRRDIALLARKRQS